MQTFSSLSSDFVIRPQSSAFYREDIFLSPDDASRFGLSKTDQFVLLSIEPPYPGPPSKEYVVFLQINLELSSGIISINQYFLADLGSPASTAEISFRPLERHVFLEEIVIESSVELLEVKDVISTLKRDYADIFTNRCLLYTTTNRENELQLRVQGYASFYLRPLKPTPNMLMLGTSMIITEKTSIKLFTPHRKNAVDMVIIVDGSGSMTQYEDYINHREERDSRLAGVRYALDKLLHQRLLSAVVSHVLPLWLLPNIHVCFILKIKLLWWNCRWISIVISFARLSTI